MFVYKFLVGLLCLCFLFVKALCKVGVPCNSTTAIEDSPCLPDSELCDATTGKCQCTPEYNEVNSTCLSPQTTPNYSSLVDNQGDGSLIAGILIPFCLIAFVICSIYVTRRFELVRWLREKLGQRDSNYDEFMIGQDDDDDPPLV